MRILPITDAYMRPHDSVFNQLSQFWVIEKRLNHYTNSMAENSTNYNKDAPYLTEKVRSLTFVGPLVCVFTAKSLTSGSP